MRSKLGKGRWFFLHPYSNFSIKRHAKSDGRQMPPIPHWENPEQPPFVKNLEKACDLDIEIFRYRWVKKDKKLKQKWVKSTLKIDKYIERIANITSMQKRNSFTQKDGNIAKLIGYYLFVLTLCILEFPLNFAAFSEMSSMPIGLWMLALGVSLAILASAHFVGVVAQKEINPQTKGTIIVALVLSPLVLMFGLAFTRVQVLRQFSVENSSAFWVYFSVNVLFFLTTAVYSWIIHDPEYYEGSLDQLEEFAEKIQLRFLRWRTARIEVKQGKAYIKRTKELDRNNKRINALIQDVGRLKTLYQIYNLKKRRDRDQHFSSYPNSYNESIATNNDKNIQGLDWDFKTVIASRGNNT